MYMTPNKARAIVERDEEKAIAAFDPYDILTGNYPYDEQFIGYLYLKRPTWILPCHKLFFAPTWRHVADILNDCENNEKIAQEKIDKKMFSLLENKHPGGGWCMSALDEDESWKIYAALKH